jgi:DNA mismatch repair ATPase MutS
MMDSRVRNDKILFLYKLVDGHVQKSFGLNVAKSVGINSFILKVAE